MSLANALRAARARFANGTPLFLALHIETDDEQAQRAVGLLTQVFLPAAAQLEAALGRWSLDRTSANEQSVVRACRAPGGAEQLWQWVESKDRQPWDILRGLDVAILRAKRMRGDTCG